MNDIILHFEKGEEEKYYGAKWKRKSTLLLFPKFSISTEIGSYIFTKQINLILNLFILQDKRIESIELLMTFKDIPPGLVLSVSLEHRNADYDDLLAGRWGIHFHKRIFNANLIVLSGISMTIRWNPIDVIRSKQFKFIFECFSPSSQ